MGRARSTAPNSARHTASEARTAGAADMSQRTEAGYLGGGLRRPTVNPNHLDARIAFPLRFASMSTVHTAYGKSSMVMRGPGTGACALCRAAAIA